MLINYLLLFLFGLLVGSFLNVVVYREIHNQKLKVKQWLPSWILGRSSCDHCQKTIPWYDNIPLVSYLLLKGKCRFCDHKISFGYPFVELLTGFEFIWVYWLLQRFSFFARAEGFYSFTLLLYWIYIFSSLIVIFIADLKAGIIPDWVVLPAIIISLLRLLESGRWQFLLTAMVAAAFFLFLFWITKKKGLGLGDVKLVFLMGLFLGYPLTVVALFLAFLTGALTAVILVMTRKKHFGQTIPFGPFLVVATMVAKIWGNLIWNWYLNIIL